MIPSADGLVISAPDVEREQQFAELRSVVEHAGDAIMSLDRRGRFRLWSRSAELMYGYREDEVLGRTPELLAPAGSRPEQSSAVASVLAGEQVEPFRAERRRKDGSTLTVEITLMPLYGADGQVRATASVHRDVSQEMSAVGEAERLRALQRATLDALIDPHFLFQAVSDDAGDVADFVCIDANVAADDYWSGEPGHLVGRAIRDILPNEGPVGLVDRFAEVLRTGESLAIDDLAYRSVVRGEVRHFDVRAVKVGDAISVTGRDVTDRHRAATALAASEQLLRTVLDGSADPTVMLDPDHRVVYMNRRAGELAGGSEGWLGRSFVEVGFPVETATEFEQAIATAGAAGTVLTQEFELAGGAAPIHYEVRIAPISDAQGVSAGAIITARDVTDRVEGERERNLLSTAITNSTEAVVIGDERGRIVYANPAALELTGMRLDELLGREPTAVHPGLLEPEVYPHIREVVAAGRSWRGELVDRSDPDRLMEHEIVVSPVMTDGRPTAFVAVLRDISRERSLESHLASEQTDRRAARSAEQALLRASPVAIVSTDLERRVTAWNPAAERIFGWSADEVIGQIAPIVDDEHLDAFLARGASQAEGPTQGQNEYRHRDGSRIVGYLSTNPLVDGDGRIVGVVGAINDITDQVQLARTLADEREERRSLAATLGAVVSGSSPEETARALCRATVTLDGIIAAAVVRECPDGEMSTLGVDFPAGVEVPDGQRGPIEAAQAVIRGSGTTGPWASPLDPATWGNGPVVTSLADRGLTVLGGAPVAWDGRTVAHIICGGDSRAQAWGQRHVPVFAEIANHVGALLGPQLAEQDRVDRLRVHVRDAIDQRSFRPVAQVVVDLATESIVGYEALTRFSDGSRPDLMFAEAASVELGQELEVACLSAALEQQHLLAADAWLSLNVSPGLILSGVLVDLLAEVTRPIVLEVTEHTEISNYDDLAAALSLLPDVRIAVDDAGAGYASLRHIAELRPDIVKLDVGLIRDIDRDPARQALVAGMRHFAEQTSTTLLAEGIERQEEAETLRALGIHLAQGFLFGRPQPFPSD